MKIEDQVCSLDLARKLKELGVKQDSLFYWIEDLEAHYQPCAILVQRKLDDYEYQYSAFSCAELGVMLSAGVTISKVNNHFIITHQDLIPGKNFQAFQGFHLSNLMAHMLTHLIENNLITVDEVNSRL